jgi:hypothetical protein
MTDFKISEKELNAFEELLFVKYSERDDAKLQKALTPLFSRLASLKQYQDAHKQAINDIKGVKND